MNRRLAALPVIFVVFTGFIFSDGGKLDTPDLHKSLLGIGSAEEQSARIETFVRKHPHPSEIQKISYLLDVIRHSESRFIRNGEAHACGKAAQWLRWKMMHRQFRGNPIRSARDFVARVASHSNKTGQDYWIILPCGTQLKTAEVLSRELDALEARLQAVPSQDSGFPGLERSGNEGARPVSAVQASRA